MHAFPPKRLSFPMTPMDGDTPASPSNVASRARYFEELLRSHVQLSFSRRRRSSSGGMGVELTDLAATECVASTSGDEGAAQLTRQVCSRAFASPLARMSSCRRTEDALEGLIAETSRIMSTQPESSNHAEKLEALSQRLADVAHALSSKDEEVQNLQQVMKALTETRAEAIQLKISCLESYNKLQADYGRVIKAAQLAQQTARHNLSKALQAKATLRDTQDRLHRERATSTSLLTFNQQLQARNRVLEARLAALEAAMATQPGDCRQSVCQQVYKDLSIMRNVGLY